MSNRGPKTRIAHGMSLICMSALAAVMLAGCGAQEDEQLRAESARVAVAAAAAASIADKRIKHQISPTAARREAQAIAKDLREYLRAIVALKTEGESRFLSSNIADLALEAQQQTLLIAGDPSRTLFMPLRRERLRAVADNAKVLAAPTE